MIESAHGVDYEKAFEALAIQPHLQAQLIGWIERGQNPDRFLFNVIKNDLAAVFGSHDRTDQAAVRGVVRFLIEYAPASCWGQFYSFWAQKKKAQVQSS